MLSINDEGNIIFQIGEIQFNLDNNEEYKQFVIFLTEPRIDGRNQIGEDDLAVKESLDNADKKLCEKYAEFIKKFEVERLEILRDSANDSE